MPGYPHLNEYPTTMNGNNKTDFLTANSTFLIGIGSVMNLAGNYYSFNTTEDWDRCAIASDWAMIGQDIANAVRSDAAEQNPAA
jgi:hypothetical protein